MSRQSRSILLLLLLFLRVLRVLLLLLLRPEVCLPLVDGVACKRRRNARIMVSEWFSILPALSGSGILSASKVLPRFGVPRSPRST